MDHLYNCVRADWLIADLSRRAPHNRRDRRIRRGFDLDPGGEICRDDVETKKTT